MSDYVDAGPHELPDVPLARPIRAAPYGGNLPLAYAPAAPTPMLSRGRSLAELLALIPAVIIGSLVASIILGRLVQPMWPEFDVRWLNVGSSLIVGATMVAAVILMLRLGGHRMDTIGWTRRRFLLDAWIGLSVFMASYFVIAIVAAIVVTLNPEILEREPEAQRAIRETFPPLTLWGIIAVMLFVAIWEEVVFRGFMLTRLFALMNRWWLVLPVGAVIFAVPHIYQGVLAVTMIIILALIMSTLFIWRRSLTAPIVFHFANNVVMLLVVRWLTNWE
jgi:uncharacterized protein